MQENDGGMKALSVINLRKKQKIKIINFEVRPTRIINK
jgi:hypothetical protein